MTAETIIGLSIAITVIAWMVRFAVWIMWPREVPPELHEHVDAEGR